MRLPRLVALLGLIATVAIAATVALWLYPDRGTPTPARAATITITVGDTWFCDASFQDGVCDTTISVGDTVLWDFSGAALSHSTTECGASCDTPTTMPLWDSGIISDGSSFPFMFNTPGTYLYRCMVHPTFMRGRIIAQGGAATPTRTPTPRATPAATPPGRVGDVDCSGSVSAIDAALVLQFDARLLSMLRCPQNADVNGDGSTNSIDAALILQFSAGLLGQLPP